jgi:hypothetical protein
MFLKEGSAFFFVPEHKTFGETLLTFIFKLLSMHPRLPHCGFQSFKRFSHIHTRVPLKLRLLIHLLVSLAAPIALCRVSMKAVLTLVPNSSSFLFNILQIKD